MYPVNIVALGQMMNEWVAEQSDGEAIVEHMLRSSRELTTIRFVDLARMAHCSIEEYLRGRSAQAQTLGILGMGAIGKTVIHQAHFRFGMKILYHHARPTPKIEAEYGACFLSVDEILQQADLICVVLPSTSMTEWLICGYRHIPFYSTQAKTVVLAWRRSPPIERMLAYLSAHYAERIYLDDLAAVARLSKFHLLRRFAGAMGTTPHRYQLLLRVSHAKAMLRDGERIGEIASRVGFCDQSHFHRYFRFLVGVTPGQYQKIIFNEKHHNFVQDSRQDNL